MSQTKAQLISDLVQALNFTGTASAPANGLFLSASNQLKLATASTERLKIDGTEVVVNDTGASVDFRVEGDTEANLLFVDASADRVGIGTASPSRKLHLVGSNPMVLIEGSGGNGRQYALASSDDTTGAAVDGGNAGTFAIYDDTANAARLVINSSGNVGIRETSPTYPTEIKVSDTTAYSQSTTNSTQHQLRINNAGLGGVAGILLTAEPSSGSAGHAGIRVISPSSGKADMTFSVRDAGTYDEKLRIQNDGRVGIGTTSPEETLDLGNATQMNLKIGGRGYIGQAYSTAATILGHSVKAKTTGTTSGGMIVTETNSGGGAPSALRMQSGSIEFHTAASGTQDADFNSNERMRIDSSGRLLIGHSSSLAAASGGSQFSLQVLGTSFATSTLNSQRYANDVSGASILLNKSRGGLGNHTIVQTDDELGKIRFYGSDGNDFENYAAEIAGLVDAAPGNNAMPGRLIFKTTTTSSPSPAERMRIDSQGRVKIAGVGATISNHASATTLTPLYLQTVTDLTAVGTAEGAATTGLFRMYDASTNTDRYHGIELRNKSNGDIRILNQDRNTSDRGDLVVGMPQAGNGGGIQEKIRISGLFDSVNIAGKGGATLLGPSDSGYNKQKTDVYISTKTGVTAINTQAGDEVAGLIRFEDTGSSNNRFHGIEIRNRNSGDIRILNKDIGVSNKADMVFAVDSGSNIIEVARFLNSGGLAFGGETTAAHALDDYEEGTHTPTMVNLDVPSHVTTNHFNFTKVGRLVHFNAKFTVSSSVNDNSGFGFTLPFTQAGSRENVFTAISDRSGTNTEPFALVLNANQSNCYAKILDGFGNATYNSFGSNIVLVTGTYESN